MIEIGIGILSEVASGPHDSFVEIGLSQATGKHTTQMMSLVPNSIINGKISRLFIRTSKTSKGRHTEIGFGELYYNEGRVGIKKAGNPEHYGSELLVIKFVGKPVTLVVELE